MGDRRVEVLPGDRAVLVENGPMRLVIQAYNGLSAELDLAREAADYSCQCLARVAAALPILRKNHRLIDIDPVDELARAMVDSVRIIGDVDLTPMAAVAGTIADFVADWLVTRGATKVIVDNGGDIAIRLGADSSASVGLRPVVNCPTVSHVVHLRPAWPSWRAAGGRGKSLMVSSWLAARQRRVR